MYQEMGIVLLVFFIVSETDFQQSLYKNTVVSKEFLIDYILLCSGSLVTLSEMSLWILVIDWNLLLLCGQKSGVHFYICVCRWSNRKNVLSIEGNFLHL